VSLERNKSKTISNDIMPKKKSSIKPLMNVNIQQSQEFNVDDLINELRNDKYDNDSVKRTSSKNYNQNTDHQDDHSKPILMAKFNKNNG
jgi:hypothetical protein